MDKADAAGKLELEELDLQEVKKAIPIAQASGLTPHALSSMP